MKIFKTTKKDYVLATDYTSTLFDDYTLMDSPLGKWAALSYEGKFVNTNITTDKTPEFLKEFHNVHNTEQPL